MMFRSIKFELSRALRDKYFIISLLIGGIIVALDIVTFYTQYIESKKAILIQAWIGTDFAFAYHSLYYILLPVIACLAYGGSHYMDMSTGYNKNIILRTKRSCYLISKMIAVFVSAFLSVAIPLLCNLFIVAGIYRNELPERLTFTTAGIIDSQRFPVLFSENPVTYCLLFIIIGGVFGGLLGLISIMVSRWCRSAFSAIMFPFVLYTVTGALLKNANGTSYAVQDIIDPLQAYTVDAKVMIVYFVAMFLMSVFVIWFGERKRDIL